MEKVGIMGFLEEKSILVTGATGFLGKLFVEKVLRVQPNVRRLYLLLRASDTLAAAERLWNEVLGKDLFRVLKEQHGEGFHSFISSKLIPVAGDVGEEGLGVETSSLREALQSEIHVIVNSAATTRFDERYDVALRTNTFGAKHVMDFSKKCPKLEMLLHVSTAYVSGEKTGMIFEKPFCMGETLNGLSVLSIEEECSVVSRRLKELDAAKSTKMEERVAMRKLGMQRAKTFGWPNTYVFTKAMGEMLISQVTGNLPIAIVRPAMVSTTCKEPFPGWIEGCRTFDSLIIAYAKGNLSSVFANPRAIMDTVPGDLVINAMISIMVYQLCQRHHLVYHVGSSSRNPLTFGMLADYVYHYFLANPPRRKDGRQIIQARGVTFYRSKMQFNLRVKLPFYLVCKGLNLANIASFHSITSTNNNLKRVFKYLMRMAELYEPFAFFKGTFDTQNTERVREATVEGCPDGKTFDFDVSNIDWEDYLVSTHIPGLLRYELK
ncbi:hypothetical protein Taro_008491 [Colocasia esculenta]|uniref:Fatty acyl-CoA reductase n=1 Tax=Colocasia esculenta TaxID=4460 RepID=A0A843U1Z9_COLES|nr:hypothetical protein [Colocasia esculenta]